LNTIFKRGGKPRGPTRVPKKKQKARKRGVKERGKEGEFGGENPYSTPGQGKGFVFKNRTGRGQTKSHAAFKIGLGQGRCKQEKKGRM